MRGEGGVKEGEGRIVTCRIQVKYNANQAQSHDTGTLLTYL